MLATKCGESQEQTSRNFRINLSHTLASNEPKQPTSILAEKNLLQQKLKILHHTTDKRGLEENTVTLKQKDRNVK